MPQSTKTTGEKSDWCETAPYAEAVGISRPQAAAKTGNVVMLIQSGIHAGEIEGKNPELMLVRDIASLRGEGLP